MRYHLFQKVFGKMVKIKETSFILSKCLVSIARHCMPLESTPIHLNIKKKMIIHRKPRNIDQMLNICKSFWNFSKICTAKLLNMKALFCLSMKERVLIKVVMQGQITFLCESSSSCIWKIEVYLNTFQLLCLNILFFCQTQSQTPKLNFLHAFKKRVFEYF